MKHSQKIKPDLLETINIVVDDALMRSKYFKAHYTNTGKPTRLPFFIVYVYERHIKQLSPFLYNCIIRNCREGKQIHGLYMVYEDSFKPTQHA